jgi:hypothetical protein
MMIYSDADIHTDGTFVSFSENGNFIRCSLIESIKVRRYPTEGTTDLTIRMVSGHKFRYTVHTAVLRSIMAKLAGGDLRPSAA